MFAVLAWTAIETERMSGLGALKAEAVAAMHESPLAYLWTLTPHQVSAGAVFFFHMPHARESPVLGVVACLLCFATENDAEENRLIMKGGCLIPWSAMLQSIEVGDGEP